MEDAESLLPGENSREAGKKLKKYGRACLRLWMCFGLFSATAILFVYSAYTVDDFEEQRFSTAFSRGAANTRWTWSCEEGGTCTKTTFKTGRQVSLESCNMLCGHPQIWPKPSRIDANTRQASSFFLQQIHLDIIADDPAKSILSEAFDIFHLNVRKLEAKSKTWFQRSDVDHFLVRIAIVDSTTVKLSLGTNESYELSIERRVRDVSVNVTAQTFFGARHALETLSQLIWWDVFDDGGMLKILHDVRIHDEPSFSYRGLMVDTARNYFPIGLLENVLVGMAANKLNAFHWHLTDSQSFPFYSPNFPYLAEDGAYGPDMVYTSDDIRGVIDFARVRGIRVIIEIDAPAHTLSGWEWGPDANASDFIVKSPNGINGQLNPDNPYALDILSDVYSDVLKLMGSDEMFHIGGDEVDLSLWRDLDRAKNYTNLSDLWLDVIVDMLNTLKAANNGVSPRNVVLWSSKLTENPKLKRYLNPSTTIVQYWYGNSRQFKADRFKVILSRVDHWYLDCGFGAWRENASPNCDPFRTWQTFYRATPWVDFDADLVVGGEVCMWAEQVGEDSLEARIWPRAAAYAERIWSNPEAKKIPPEVYTRLDSQIARMRGRGIKSAVQWPLWCTQNPTKCY